MAWETEYVKEIFSDRGWDSCDRVHKFCIANDLVKERDMLKSQLAEVREALKNLVNDHPAQLHPNKPVALINAEKLIKGE